MKILNIVAENFGSYESVVFNTADQGLTLVHGPTGSGKSTLCDLVSWGLFGVTAKGGKVDEIVSWSGGVTEVSVKLEDGTWIVRTRGSKTKDNDLLLYNDSDDFNFIRGKDLLDTQRFINEKLGVDIELYLNAAYFHEFSQSAQFFTTTPKNRRTICEQLVDLSLPIKLQNNTVEAKKQLKTDLQDNSLQLGSTKDRIQTYSGLIEQTLVKENNWVEAQRKKISELKQKYDNFEAEKQLKAVKLQQDYERELKKIDTKEDYESKIAEYKELLEKESICIECGTRKCNEDLEGKIKEYEKIYLANCYIEAELSYLEDAVREVNALQNTYLEALQQAEKQLNPYSDQISEYAQKSCDFNVNYKKLLATNSQLKEKAIELQILEESLVEMRSVLLQDTIVYLQDTTNKYLTEYFDAEIKLLLSVTDAEKLDFELAKNGYFCVYTQLSKGQRQLLKLCFGIAVMKCIANRHNFRPSSVYFDEVLDGMDAEIKKKAFSLLKSLEIDYESIFVVDHGTEMKALFTNEICVSMSNGKSTIEKS